MVKPVGFDQKIFLHHLDYTAKQSGKQSKTEMYEMLDGYLRQDITGTVSRKHAITILMKIWYNVPTELAEIKDEVVRCFNDFSKEERLFAHWNMTLAAYPFFKDLVNEYGRLFQLQDQVSSPTIGKRMKDLYGDRVRVEVATRAVNRSLRDWEVISPSQKLMYVKNEKITISNPVLQALLFHILLYISETESMYTEEVLNHPILFPFEIDLQVYELRERTEEFAFHYQGVEKLIVEKI